MSFHTADGMSTTAYQMGRECCLRVVALADGEPGGILGNTGGLSTSQWTAKYAWHMQVPRYTPATHETDTTVHLTQAEHSGLAEILARKDDLLALLA